MVQYQEAFNTYQRGPNPLSLDDILELEKKDNATIRQTLQLCGLNNLHGLNHDALYSLLTVSFVCVTSRLAFLSSASLSCR